MQNGNINKEIEKQNYYMQLVKAIADSRYGETGRRPLAFIHTYGCQQNVSDSEKIQGMLEEMGYEKAETAAQADFVLFNTCAVREHAEQRVFGNVGALKPFKARRPGMLIALCGCMMQQEQVAEKIRRHYTHVDLVFGTGVLYRLPELLYRALAEKGRVFDITPQDAIAEGLPVRRDGKVKAFLPVMYGCNNFCAYCIVPHVRGRERSREPEAVLEEAKRLLAQGYKEIMLLGQNVNSYGAGAGFSCDFAQLLQRINDLPGDFRIRFMTSHPKDLTAPLIRAIAACEKVERHLHLPFQAGSDRILGLMNRRYTRGRYLALVDEVRSAVPELSLTSDVIVGFPGETYEEFQETLDLVRRVKFDNLFTFIYSRREGTPAAKLADPVPHGEKVRWFEQLLALQNGITEKRMNRLVGRSLRVLCEGPAKTGKNRMTGRTSGGIAVDFEADEAAVGQFVNVVITQARRAVLLGTLRADTE